jgi:hypothetical protein
MYDTQVAESELTKTIEVHTETHSTNEAENVLVTHFLAKDVPSSLHSGRRVAQPKRHRNRTSPQAKT